MKRAALAMLVTTLAVFTFASSSRADTIVLYVAPTGQTATAAFSFLSGTQLQITLTETTPASVHSGPSGITGAGAILTSLGFLLPGSTAIVGGNVTVAPGSTSVGFIPGCAGGQCGPGSDVSGEWGATPGGLDKPIGSTPESYWDFVSTMAAQTTRFAGANVDNPASLDGPQAGLLDDSAVRGGQGVVDNSVIILLNLDADPSTGGIQALTQAQMDNFLAGLWSNSIVEWGSDAAFGPPVPEPGTLALFGSGLLGLAGAVRRRLRG